MGDSHIKMKVIRKYLFLSLLVVTSLQVIVTVIYFNDLNSGVKIKQCEFSDNKEIVGSFDILKRRNLVIDLKLVIGGDKIKSEKNKSKALYMLPIQIDIYNKDNKLIFNKNGVVGYNKTDFEEAGIVAAYIKKNHFEKEVTLRLFEENDVVDNEYHFKINVKADNEFNSRILRGVVIVKKDLNQPNLLLFVLAIWLNFMVLLFFIFSFLFKGWFKKIFKIEG
ncbi:MAG: hypothetical protein JW969_10420 [Spirochaetales bacterium]|nr:hypothetical protein [Spirochaetales bacterium]